MNDLERFELLVSIRNVYGNEMIYPECERSRVFANIAGNTTLTPKTMHLLERLGYVFKVKVPTLKNN